jgi:hypothetical protein
MDGYEAFFRDTTPYSQMYTAAACFILFFLLGVLFDSVVDGMFPRNVR